MGGSWRRARISALPLHVLGGFRSGTAAGTKTFAGSAIRDLAAHPRRYPARHLHQLLERRTSVVCAVEGDQELRCIGPADAADAVHQPGRSDVAIDDESD